MSLVQIRMINSFTTDKILYNSHCRLKISSFYFVVLSIIVQCIKLNVLYILITMFSLHLVSSIVIQICHLIVVLMHITRNVVPLQDSLKVREVNQILYISFVFSPSKPNYLQACWHFFWRKTWSLNLKVIKGHTRSLIYVRL